MKTYKYIGITFVLSLILCGLISCNDDDDSAYWYETFTIEPYKSTFNPGGNDPRIDVPCYVSYNSKNEKVFIEHIEGFDELFEEGTKYTLRINVTHHKGSDNPDDYSYYTYKFVEILKEEPAAK